MSRFFGKYRGKIVNTVDPMQMGRIQVSVPAVLDDGTVSWAMPCTPFAGPNVGFFAIPPPGANIWVEFEGGDPGFPIWSGCFWGRGELPTEAHSPGTNLFKTAEVTLTLADTPGAATFIVETTTGVKLEIGPEGLALDDGNGNSVNLSP